MGNIRVLDEHVANQIAAGEVVERPASVVKELVENAIDAGSTRIEITIEEGGLDYIRVLDNGCGMPADDCELAFQRHATSKITAGSDLFQIRTLGFRGEALPSIAAVSKLTCTTSAEESGLARQLVIHGGHVEAFSECAGPRGTDVQVRELFYNTPARLKYMKTIQTELSNVSDYVQRMALAQPAISFSLTHNGQRLLQTPGQGDLLQTIAAIYGTAAAKLMVPVQVQTIDYELNGWVAKPELNRANRQAMTFIVNGRFIKNYALSHALIEAYHTLLPLHRFPLAVFHIQMDPQLVDVNVHPAKLEVRFSKEFELTRLVTDTVRNKWARQDLVPQIIRAETAGPTAPMAPVSPAPPPYRELPLFTPRTIDRLLEAPPVQEQPPTPQLPKLFPVGQVHGTYIVAQNERGMYLIDQHAAHERIHYEQFLGKMAQTEVVSQDLLVPMTLTFTATEAHLVTQKLPFLEAVGVWLEPFGGNSFIVRSHPAWFPVGDEQRIIEDMVDWLLQEKQTPDIGKIREKTAIMAACKASIRANDSLTVTAMETLLERLRACRMPFTCPHGRPIVISFSVHELEKLFKRVT